jgi:carbamoyl-phosphate synthase small subunit
MKPPASPQAFQAQPQAQSGGSSQHRRPALLALEDGSVFHGLAFGAHKTVVAEGVFNTSMTGYQEILTDPSYYGQIVVMTTPMMGNYGVQAEACESDTPKAWGWVVRELCHTPSHFKSQQSMHSYLEAADIPGIEGIDTRYLTQLLRSKGVMKACLSTDGLGPQEAIEKARQWQGFDGWDVAACVSTPAPYTLEPSGPQGRPVYHVIAYDYGAKRSIFRYLCQVGFRVTVVPARTPAAWVQAQNPDAVFLSNGPGDPAALTYAHEAVRELMPQYPIFGICMGHQLITHALGGRTFKLRFGHRGGNQPVKNLETGRVRITSQNHGYASDTESLRHNPQVIPTEINLNDHTLEGLRHAHWPTFCVQYHPEAGPGPHDALDHFEDFYQLVCRHKR